MKTETAKKAGTGLGLSAAAVIWMFATFAERSDLRECKEMLREMQQQVHEIHTRVVVLDAWRENEQAPARRRYE